MNPDGGDPDGSVPQPEPEEATPTDPMPSFTQTIVTKSGRLKMVHEGTGRTQDWVHCVSGARSVDSVWKCAPDGSIHLTATRVSENGPAMVVSPSDSSGRVASIEFNILEVSCREEEGSIYVPLRRVGDLSQRVAWPWRAKNGSVDDRLYRNLPQSGCVVFEVDQALATIELGIPNDGRWNAECVYFVELVSADPTLTQQHGISVFLGVNRQVRIYSLNSQTFPAAAYGQLGDTCDEAQVNEYKLSWKFVEHVFTQIPNETKWGVGLSLVPPIMYYISQLNFALLVNCGLAVRTGTADCSVGGVDWGFIADSSFGDASEYIILWWVGFMTVIIVIIQHITETMFRHLRLGGKATIKVRADILLTMLNLSDEASERFDNGDIEKCLDTEADAAVRMVWLNTFRLLTQCGDLLAEVVLSTQIILRRGEVRGSTAVLLVCPLLMALAVLIVFYFRRERLRTMFWKTFEAEEHCAAFVNKAAYGRPVVRSYRQAWCFVECFKDLHRHLNAKNIEARSYTAHTLWALNYIFLAARLAVLFVGGRQVIEGNMSAGEFLVLLKAVGRFGSDLAAAANTQSEIMLGSVAVQKLANVLNAETYRFQARKKVLVQDELREQHAKDDLICLRDVRCAYPDCQLGDFASLPPLELELPTGEVICFCDLEGGSGMPIGTNTLFNIIAGRLQPATGRVVVPKRWQIVYVPVVPILFDGTLMYNLMFGAQQGKQEEVVWDICRRLGLSASLIGKGDFDVGSDAQNLRFSDRVIVSVARALMSDVDLLLLSSALDVLGEVLATQVIDCLREISRTHGIHHHLPMHLRHRKTTIYRSKFQSLQDRATVKVRVYA